MTLQKWEHDLDKHETGLFKGAEQISVVDVAMASVVECALIIADICRIDMEAILESDCPRLLLLKVAIAKHPQRPMSGAFGFIEDRQSFRQQRSRTEAHS